MNRWLSARFNLLSAAVVGITGFIAVMTPGISASTAGFALAFASTITSDVSLFPRSLSATASHHGVVVVLSAALCWFGTIYGKEDLFILKPILTIS